MAVWLLCTAHEFPHCEPSALGNAMVLEIETFPLSADELLSYRRDGQLFFSLADNELDSGSVTNR